MLCLGRHTVTGLLTTAGSQFEDWTSAYRLFSQDRLPVTEIFGVVRRSLTGALEPGAPFCAVLDDTLLRRAGRHVPGVAWRRDPLGPPFQTNFVRAQRFLQISASLPGSSRLTPIGFYHTPTPQKPSKKASDEAQALYRQTARANRLSLRAAQQITQLRHDLDQDPAGTPRPLLIAFDGAYTNATVLKQLPARTTAIGRIRQDAKLCYCWPTPVTAQSPGRPKRYGPPAPTPEQLRVDETHPWESMTLTQAGVKHQLRFKRLTNLLWRPTGTQQPLQLLVIAPLHYRLRKGSKLLYRDPAFLLCTDPQLTPSKVIATYFQRWDIEVNFRDEKTLLGVGQAQVRAARSVVAAPAFAVASYSLLLLAAQRAFGDSSVGLIPPPKWAAPSAPRNSTQHLLHQLRAEVWGRGLGLANFSGFVPHPTSSTKPKKRPFPLTSAAFYANA